MKLDLYNHIDSKLIENGSVEIFYDKIVWIDTVGYSQGMRIAGTPRVQQSIKGEKTIDYKLVELSKGDLLRRKFKLTHKIESTPLKRLTSNEYYVSIGILGELKIKYWRKEFYFQKKELGRRIIDMFLGAIIGTIVTLFITTTFQSSNKTKNAIGESLVQNEKTPILLADREAPLGWISLKIYNDYSFEFVSSGLRTKSNVFVGSVRLSNDTLFFNYKDSIPKAGSIAIIRNNLISYINGKYPERIEIKLNKLSKEK